MNSTVIYVFATWVVKEGNLKTVLSLLAEVGAKSKKEEGNLWYKIHQSTSDPNVIVLAEAYADEDAVNAHRSSTHFQELVIGKIVPLLEKRDVVVTKAVAE